MQTVTGIVYNTGTEILPDILNFIDSQQGIYVDKIERIYLNELYDDFFDDIYRLDKIPKYDVDLKKNFVKNPEYEQCIYILSIMFSQLSETYSERKKRLVYVESENLKFEIRNRFKKYVENYFHDILFHSADCDKEQEYLSNVIMKYKNCCLTDEIYVLEDNIKKESNSGKRIRKVIKKTSD